MTTWPRSAPTNQTTPIHQHNSRVEDSPSDPLGLLTEETPEYREEYPQEVAEEVEEAVVEEEAEEEEVSLLSSQHNQQLPTEEINSLAIHHSYSQEIAQNRRRS